MTNVFTYGSLMFKEVIYGLVHQKQYESTKATLKDYSRHQVKQRVYPGVKKNKGHSVQGVLYFGVTPQDLQILHNFERAEYIPETVQVITPKGPVEAIVYLYVDTKNLLDKDWDQVKFQKKDKEHFAFLHTTGDL